MTKKGKDFWGPELWALIHVSSFCYKPSIEKDYIEFLWLLTKLLPCDYCKKNLEYKLQKYPPEKYTASGGRGVFLYSYLLHDLANQHINEFNSVHHPEIALKISPPYDDVVEFYSDGMLEQKEKFWGPKLWACIHILSATLRAENAEYYKRFLEIVCGEIVPNSSFRKSFLEFYKNNNVNDYLRNNHDAFLYSYMLHTHINKEVFTSAKVREVDVNLPPYKEMKYIYFSSLGEECNDCRV